MAAPEKEDAQPGTRPADPERAARDAAARHLDEQLDEALADSFPASDPVSFVTSQTEEDWAEDPPRKP